MDAVHDIASLIQSQIHSQIAKKRLTQNKYNNMRNTRSFFITLLRSARQCRKLCALEIFYTRLLGIPRLVGICEKFATGIQF